MTNEDNEVHSSRALSDSRREVLMAAGFKESEMSEALFWEVWSGIHKGVESDLNSIYNVLETPQGKQAAADIAVEMFKHKKGPVDPDHSIDIGGFPFTKNGKAYLLDAHLQIPTRSVTTGNFIFDGASLREEMTELPQWDSSMGFYVKEIQGTALKSETEMDIPTHITFDSNGRSLHIYGTDGSQINLQKWGESEVIEYINDLNKALRTKRENT